MVCNSEILHTHIKGIKGIEPSCSQSLEQRSNKMPEDSHGARERRIQRADIRQRSKCSVNDGEEGGGRSLQQLGPLQCACEWMHSTLAQ